MVKKIWAAIIVIIMFFSFISCAGESAESDVKIIRDNIKIGVIYIGDPADGIGYSYAHDQGINAMRDTFKLRDNQIVRKLNVPDGNITSVKTAIEDCISKGCNVIFGTSYGYMESMESLAKEYENVIFSNAAGNESNDINFNNYFGRIYQACYLSGIAAGLKTLELQDNNMGYVAVYETKSAEISSEINAFVLGAQSVNPNAVVNVKVLNSGDDSQKETTSTETLLSAGCCVIAQHCDSSNPQTAAEKANMFGCGYNSDMTIDAPKAHLTAPVWNWGIYYTQAVQAVLDGRWSSFGNYYAGIKEGFVGISPLSVNCADNTQEYIDQVKALFNESSWDVFSGVKLSFDENCKIIKIDADLLKDDGSVIVEAGRASIADSVITETMNYYVKGVTGEKIE